MKIKDLEKFYQILKGLGVDQPELLTINDFRKLNEIKKE